MESFDKNQLINRAAIGDASDEDLVQLCQILERDAPLAAKLRAELRFSEWIRLAIGEALPLRSLALMESLENRDLTLEERLSLTLDGELSGSAADELARLLLDFPEEAVRLKSDLEVDEWIAEVVAPSKSEEAFVNALVTRMWAETFDDRFVDDLAKKLKEIERAKPDDVVSFRPVRASIRLASIAAVAALFALGAFLITSLWEQKDHSGAYLAKISKMSDDVVWSEEAGPEKDGSIKSGLYKLESGTVSLFMANGKGLAIEGPATFEVSENGEAILHQGLALATLAPDSDRREVGHFGHSRIGLSSPNVRFSDGAIIVGIDARSSESTEAVIFSGRSGVCFKDVDNCREVFEFEAIKADHERGTFVDVPYNPRAFSKAWELMAGVEKNLGDIVIELPGVDSSTRPSHGSEIRLFVEKERFYPQFPLTVDDIPPGYFANRDSLSEGREISGEGREMRSYLLQLWPADGENEKEVEASVTFDQPIVGVIASSERLWASDQAVSANTDHLTDATGRGLDSQDDRILLSEDGRTLTLNLRGKKSEVDQIRVLVAVD